MRKSRLFMLVLLSFSVTMMVSAVDFVSINPFELELTETTAYVMGGVADQLIVLDSESMAVLSVESITEYSDWDMALTTWTGSVGAYIIHEHGKWFVHPAVLGIC